MTFGYRISSWLWIRRSSRAFTPPSWGNPAFSSIFNVCISTACKPKTGWDWEHLPSSDPKIYKTNISLHQHISTEITDTFYSVIFSSQICKLYTQQYPWIAKPEHLTLRALPLFLGCLDTSVDYIQIVEKNAVRKKINSEVYVSTWKFIYLCNCRKNSTITLWR